MSDDDVRDEVDLKPSGSMAARPGMTPPFVVRTVPPQYSRRRGGGTRMSDVIIGEDPDFRAAKPPRSNLVRDVDFTITETRAEADGLNFEGYAAVWDRWTLINSWEGLFRESLRKGSFKKTIREARAAGRFPVMQFDHGRDPAIGALPIGVYTQMEEDDHGVHVIGRLHRSMHFEPVREAIASGAVRGMSFRFTIPEGKERWNLDTEDGIDERTILEVNCMEAGPVTFPAYVETEASVRSRRAIYLVRAVKELKSLGVSDQHLRDELGIIIEADEPVDDDDHSDDTDADSADVTNEQLDEILASLPDETDDDPADSTTESDDEPVDAEPAADHPDTAESGPEPVQEQQDAGHSDDSSDPDATPSDEAPVQSDPETPADLPVESPAESPAESPRDKRADDALFRGFDFWDFRAGDL